MATASGARPQAQSASDRLARLKERLG
jgi:hypothetical protein